MFLALKGQRLSFAHYSRPILKSSHFLVVIFECYSHPQIFTESFIRTPLWPLPGSAFYFKFSIISSLACSFL